MKTNTEFDSRLQHANMLHFCYFGYAGRAHFSQTDQNPGRLVTKKSRGAGSKSENNIAKFIFVSKRYIP